MNVTPGSRIGPYQISEKIGAGGMGEVFHAVDVNLGRAAAIKVLPASLAGDPDRMARFEREAQTLASLNHPNIAQIFGFEKGDGNFRAIAMEFVDGPTLADRIGGAPIPIDEAIPIALQIADALESAHDHGIIHRDLKPLNIKVRSDGTVKVLDFGLAKAIASSSESSAGVPADSPTITTPAMTHAGVILGTAAYMSPEQAKGRVVDRRTDIWAFGCVLFEMLTGKRAFTGDDVSDVMVAILRDEPRWSELPASTPGHVRSLLLRCLQKDPRKRLPHIAVVRLELSDPPTIPASAPSRPGGLWRAVAAAALVAAIAVPSWMIWSRPTPTAAVPLRLQVELGANRPLALTSSIALSADGTTLAFVGRSAADDTAPPMLYVRSLDRLDAMQLDGTEGAQGPFFSPDAKWIGFFTGSNSVLKKVSTSGGRVIVVCDAPAARGGSWGDDDSIVFASAGGLRKVSALGGTPESIMNAEQGAPVPFWPQLLPGGRHVIYAEALGSDPATGIIIGRSLVDGLTKELLRGRFPRYLASGHLAFFRSGAMFTVPFDPVALEQNGDPIQVVDAVALSYGVPIAAMSGNGTLVYRQGSSGGLQKAPIMWLSRSGALTPLRESPASWAFPRFSPDGSRLAMTLFDGRQSDIWVYDLARDIMTRLTTDPAFDMSPVWTPDGTGVVFGSTRGSANGLANLFWQRADGTGAARRLTESTLPHFPDGFDPDGRRLIIHEGDPATTRQSLMILPVESDSMGLKSGAVATFVGGPFLKANARISPDGRWVAYAANDTGTFEIYVQPLSGSGTRLQVSNGGGNLAVWSPTTSELYYVGDGQGRMMFVSYSVKTDAFVAAKPQPWSETRFSATPPVALYGPGIDIHPDGARFVVTPPRQATEDPTREATQLVVVLNSFDGLRRAAPQRGGAP